MEDPSACNELDGKGWGGIEPGYEDLNGGREPG